MTNKIEKFIQELQAYKSTENVFNPWRDYDQIYDIGPEAPQIRSNQMKQFFNSRIPGAKYLFVAEALGYQGGRFTGIALTSERMLLGKHDKINPSVILQKGQGIRTSNPNNANLKNTQRNFGFTEPTATIVWGEVIKNKIPPYQILTWNIFPFHPFNLAKGSLTNRAPTTAELESGIYYFKLLLDISPAVTVVSIGVHSSNMLNKYNIKNVYLPHPANGGASKFRSAFKKVLAEVSV